MGERPPRRRKQGQVNSPEAAHDRPCDEPADSATFENLLRSHSELCAILRLAGRQILRLGGDDESLERIRQTLKSAETLRRAWKNPDQTATDLPSVPGMLGSEHASAASEARNTDHPRTGRLSRPHAHRVLRFPTGGSSR
jgi:hypothetical protein